MGNRATVIAYVDGTKRQVWRTQIPVLRERGKLSPTRELLVRDDTWTVRITTWKNEGMNEKGRMWERQSS